MTTYLPQVIGNSLNESSSLKCTWLVLQSIPAQCDIPGNEEVFWYNYTYKMTPQKTNPEGWLPITYINQNEQVIICCLRTIRARLNRHIHNHSKIGKFPECYCGARDQTVEDILQNCCNFDDLRCLNYPPVTSLAYNLDGPRVSLKKKERFYTSLICGCRSDQKAERELLNV